MAVKALIWDFGGVLTTSPFEAFRRFERERGLPKDFLRSVNARDPDTNAWARFERAEIDADAFDVAFAEESAALGARVEGREVIRLLSGDLRPRMVAALAACKGRYRLGCITNNAPTGHGSGMARDADQARRVAEVLGLFDHVIESSKIGLRKPDPRIYEMMCERLAVSPAACVYLDDLGVNCKPAAALGMVAIKVESEAQALSDLSRALGLDVIALIGPGEQA
jgi:putative hydrolase of the HAD superfamily